MKRVTPVFIDCEASAVEGLPIEIGWAYVDDEDGPLVSEGHLIRPPPHWDIEDWWDPDAQKLHGITLFELRAQGRPVGEFADRMNQVLAGRELYAGDPHDEAWLMMIFKAAGLEPAFTISDVNAKRLISEFASGRGVDPDSYVRLTEAAARIAPHRHRAEADARQLAVLWNMVARWERDRCAENSAEDVGTL